MTFATSFVLRVVCVGVIFGVAGCGESTDASVPSLDGDGDDEDVPVTPTGPSVAGTIAANSVNTYGAAGPIPLSSTQPRMWQAVKVAGASCDDGSPAGFRVNINPESDKLAIFLEQGGACVPGACVSVHDDSVGNQGIFDRRKADNPFRDWNYVYVPYCTGDLHAGNRRDVDVDGSRRQFLGYHNLGLFLDQIVPAFHTATQVALIGSSAGSLGATLNYPRIQAAFDPIEVVLLADSGPLMPSPWLAPCEQRLWRDTWNLDATVLRDCGADCPNHDDWSGDFWRHITRRTPRVRGGVFSTTQDIFIRTLYGAGLNDCKPPWLPLVDGRDYRAGLTALRKLLQSDSSGIGSYFVEGVAHICVDSACFDWTEVSGVALQTWAAGVLAGDAQHVGP